MRYEHTQYGPWSFLLAVFGMAAILGGWAAGEEPVVAVVLPAAGALMLLLGLSFRHLTVADGGDHLAVRFGPLPLFRRRIRYADIQSVEVGQTTFLDGWGIHMTPDGWLYNVGGSGAVELTFDSGSKVRIGSDEPSRLMAAIRLAMAH